MAYTIVNRPVPRTGDYIAAEGPPGHQVVVSIDASKQLNPGGPVCEGQDQAFFSGVITDGPGSLPSQSVCGTTIGGIHGTVRAMLIPPPDGWDEVYETISTEEVKQ